MNKVMDVPVVATITRPVSNGRGSKKKAEREATYQAALELLATIDADLTRGVRHYRTKAGELLTTLDEVVRAILGNDLLLEPEMVVRTECPPVVWINSQYNGPYCG